MNEHLKGIYSEGELAAGATIRKFRIVRTEGKREVAREIEHYATSVDYTPNTEISQQFFATVQSKMHWAAADANLTKLDEKAGGSRKFARYLPFWA